MGIQKELKRKKVGWMFEERFPMRHAATDMSKYLAKVTKE